MCYIQLVLQVTFVIKCCIWKIKFYTLNDIKTPMMFSCIKITPKQQHRDHCMIKISFKQKWWVHKSLRPVASISYFRVQVMHITEASTVTKKCRTDIKPRFLYFNLFLSVKLESLNLFTFISFLTKWLIYYTWRWILYTWLPVDNGCLKPGSKTFYCHLMILHSPWAIYISKIINK